VDSLPDTCQEVDADSNETMGEAQTSGACVRRSFISTSY